MPDHVEFKSAGQELTSADWNAVADAANRTLRASGSRGTKVMRTPAGLLISGDKEFIWPKPSIIVRGENITDETILALDVVQLTLPFNLQGNDPQLEGTSVFPVQTFTYPTLQVRPPIATGFGRWGVAMNQILPNGGIGPVAIDGIMVTRMIYPSVFVKNKNKSKGDMYALADRADTLGGFPFLTASQVGAAQLLWVYEMLDAKEGDVEEPQLCLIRMDGRNTEGIGVADYGDPNFQLTADWNTGISEVLIFGEHFDVEGVNGPLGPNGLIDPRLSNGVVKIVKIG